MNETGIARIKNMKMLGCTWWWQCVGCGKLVHTTRKPAMGGRNFGCGYGCKLRHCIEWDDDGAKITTYDPCVADKSQLPWLAQL